MNQGSQGWGDQHAHPPLSVWTVGPCLQNLQRWRRALWIQGLQTSCNPTQPCPFPQVPLVPLTPALSILLNICLMLNLSYLTWLRFSIWLLIGE